MVVMPMEVISKYFTTHKRGENVEDNQDSISVDDTIHRYALSDGVSNSFLPHIISGLLTKLFVEKGMEEPFPSQQIPDRFQEERSVYLDSLDDFGRMIQECAEEEFVTGSATFAGVEVIGDAITWRVIGDSCIFLIYDDGSYDCLTSDPVNHDADGRLTVAFGNHPSQIFSNGKMVGKIQEGCCKVRPKRIVIMSDAMSAWFVDRLNEKDDAINQLYSLADDDEFENFVQKEYDAGRLKDDDESVIILDLIEKAQQSEQESQSEESVPEVQPEEPEESAPEVKPEEPEESAPEVKPKEPEESVPEVKPEEPEESAPEVKPEEPEESAPEVKPEEPEESAPEVEPEDPKESVPEVKPEEPEESALEVEPEEPEESAPEVEPEEPKESGPEVKPEEPEESAPEVEPEEPKESEPEVHSEQKCCIETIWRKKLYRQLLRCGLIRCWYLKILESKR